MNFEEHAGKPVLAAHGIAVPDGRLAKTPDEAADAQAAIGPCVVKAQVPTGKRGKAGGIDHLGIQVDSEDELAEAKDRLEKADLSLLDSGEITCCYARSTKHWVIDPDGVPWETFQTHGLTSEYGRDFLTDDVRDQQKAEGEEKPSTTCC